jgi:hypothetical protein
VDARDVIGSCYAALRAGAWVDPENGEVYRTGLHVIGSNYAPFDRVHSRARAPCVLKWETNGNADANLADSKRNEIDNADRRRLARLPP